MQKQCTPQLIFSLFAQFWSFRAIAKVLLKDNAGALVDFDAAISLNPFAAHSYFNRGNLHLAMGLCFIAPKFMKVFLFLLRKKSFSIPKEIV